MAYDSSGARARLGRPGAAGRELYLLAWARPRNEGRCSSCRYGSPWLRRPSRASTAMALLATRAGPEDLGRHVVRLVMTEAFLQFSTIL